MHWFLPLTVIFFLSLTSCCFKERSCLKKNHSRSEHYSGKQRMFSTSTVRHFYVIIDKVNKNKLNIQLINKKHRKLMTGRIWHFVRHEIKMNGFIIYVKFEYNSYVLMEEMLPMATLLSTGQIRRFKFKDVFCILHTILLLSQRQQFHPKNNNYCIEMRVTRKVWV